MSRAGATLKRLSPLLLPLAALAWGAPDQTRAGGALALKALAVLAALWLLSRSPLSPLLRRRLSAALWVLIGASTLVFGALRLAPGDPIESILGEQAPPEARARLSAALCLDAPLIVQYNDCFWDHVLDGSLGHTFDIQPQPVIDQIAEHLPATVELAIAALCVALMIALPLGIIAARWRATIIDHAATAFALVGVAIPAFWLGPMLLLAFTVSFRWLPSPVDTSRPLAALLLPAITLGTALSGKLTRMIRSSVLETLGEDYVLTARAKGLPEWLIFSKHVLRNALIPIITVLGIQLGALLTGAIITEKIFARPGIGTLLLDAIQQRDYPLVQGVVLLIASSYILVNLITDLLYVVIDPRVRFER
ncbi:ABC transporter permease [Myxococcota bacterium]|nr:ABC transporter permease [Myxococcota bacterium]MBU1433105.1 ABC transporter permease [Myxococcota bacterium]MBU1900256.1 ABC transporter permease [Myxococcota bacterium]